MRLWLCNTRNILQEILRVEATSTVWVLALGLLVSAPRRFTSSSQARRDFPMWGAHGAFCGQFGELVVPEMQISICTAHPKPISQKAYLPRPSHSTWYTVQSWHATSRNSSLLLRHKSSGGLRTSGLRLLDFDPFYHANTPVPKPSTLNSKPLPFPFPPRSGSSPSPGIKTEDRGLSSHV